MNIRDISSDILEISSKQLADAIRKNGVEHVRGTFFYTDEKKNIIGACALGQAALNLKVRYFKISDDIETQCKLCGYFKGEILQMVVHLNDIHSKSLTYIADWVEGI